MKRLLLALLATAVLSSVCWGWGKEGHQIIATVGEDHLDETTKVMIQSLIGNNHLYSIGSWADDVRRDRRETGPWHYVNVPLGGRYDPSRDCALPNGCVVAKIDELAKVLTDKTAPREVRAEALKYLVHFVGDVHQPMHSVKEAAGGNGVHVSFLGSIQCGPYDCNLHGVWDTSMIQHAGMRRDEYAQHEEELIKGEKLDWQAGGTAEQWANQSLRLAQAAWVQDGTNLDEAYYEAQITVVDRQMALAGLRLAKLLNETIGRMTPRDFAAGQTAAERVVNAATAVPDQSNVKVWVNTRSGVYHCPGTRYYGNTKNGEYMTQVEAEKKGYRPVGGTVCH